MIEATGWESPLVFVAAGQVLVQNLTIRCRIQETRSICIYCPVGQPVMESCVIEGGVHAAGASTAPTIQRCVIRGSPSHGAHFSDGCGGKLHACDVLGSKAHGVVLDRGARVTVAGNRIRESGACAIMALVGPKSGQVLSDPPWPECIGDNELSGNAAGVTVSGVFSADQVAEEEDDFEARLSFGDSHRSLSHSSENEAQVRLVSSESAKLQEMLSKIKVVSRGDGREMCGAACGRWEGFRICGRPPVAGDVSSS